MSISEPKFGKLENGIMVINLNHVQRTQTLRVKLGSLLLIGCEPEACLSGQHWFSYQNKGAWILRR